MLEAARRNARALGLEQSLLFQAADLAAPPSQADGTRDLVLANPPYGLPGQGRASPLALRERALRDAEALHVFCRAAARRTARSGDTAEIILSSTFKPLHRLYKSRGTTRTTRFLPPRFPVFSNCATRFCQNSICFLICPRSAFVRLREPIL